MFSRVNTLLKNDFFKILIIDENLLIYAILKSVTSIKSLMMAFLFLNKAKKLKIQYNTDIKVFSLPFISSLGKWTLCKGLQFS